MKVKVIISTLALGLLLACSLPAAADDAAALYKSKCQMCHGPDGKGSAAGQKLGVRDFHAPEVAKESDADLFKVTKEGKNKMPKFDGKLTDDQIKELIKFVRGLK
jgi:mono/diheme cytochrome c family protein